MTESGLGASSGDSAEPRRNVSRRLEGLVMDRENAKERKPEIRRDSVARSWANSYRVIPRFSRFRSFALSRLVLASK